MKELANFLMLPTSLLALIAHCRAYTHELEWPYNLPATAKYYPEHEPHMRRDFDIRQRMKWDTPAKVKKMRSDDEGEKFFLQYWEFREEQSVSILEDLLHLNVTSSQRLLDAAIAPHNDHNWPQVNLFGRSIFARGFQCPTGTNPCTNIGSNLCCPKDQNCVSVSGGVGCCPSGETCTDVVSECDTSAGYTSCPSSPDGGCCIPNATCEGSGCVFYGTQTITATLATHTVTETQSSTPSAVSSETASPPSPVVSTDISISGYTTTQTVTVTKSVSGQATTIVSLVTQSPESTASHTTMTSLLTCTSGFQSCPASLGGGCCPTGQMCGSNNLCLSFSDSSTTATNPDAPILPTSVSPHSSQTATTSTQQTTTTISSSSNEACPTGFYMCSAYYLGGCCRVGRNCDTTSCPSTDSTIVVSSDATVVVPATTGAASTEGTCPHGWYMCPASVGGDCCPSQYLCGTSSCSATASGEQNTGKELPSSASVIGWVWTFGALAIATGIGMLWL